MTLPGGEKTNKYWKETWQKCSDIVQTDPLSTRRLNNNNNQTTTTTAAATMTWKRQITSNNGAGAVALNDTLIVDFASLTSAAVVREMLKITRQWLLSTVVGKKRKSWRRKKHNNGSGAAIWKEPGRTLEFLSRKNQKKKNPRTSSSDRRSWR